MPYRSPVLASKSRVMESSTTPGLAYTVTVCAKAPVLDSCSCPAFTGHLMFAKEHKPCKHILEFRAELEAERQARRDARRAARMAA